MQVFLVSCTSTFTEPERAGSVETPGVSVSSVSRESNGQCGIAEG